MFNFEYVSLEFILNLRKHVTLFSTKTDSLHLRSETWDSAECEVWIEICYQKFISRNKLSSNVILIVDKSLSIIIFYIKI